MPEAQTEIPKHYVPAFERNIMHANQQQRSILEMHVESGPGQGEGVSPVDLFDETDAEEATDRYGDTPIMELGRSRRWVAPRKFHWGTLVDTMDVLKQVLDPTSPMIQAATMALNRALDRQIIMPAFFGAAMQGKDMTEAPSNLVPFDTAKFSIAAVVGSIGGATPVGMNVEKLTVARRMLMANENDLSVERPKCGITAQQWYDLFQDAKVIHGDYINGDARVIGTGNLPLVLGFDFVQLEQLPFDPVLKDRYCPVWLKSQMALRRWKALQVNILPDPGKQYRPRPYIQFAAGCVRKKEGGVLRIVCREP